jgi:hypothetical protein
MRRFRLIIITHVKSLFQPYLKGGGEISKSYTIISHEPTTIIFFFYPSFRLFHHHLHAFTHKTYSAKKRLLDSRTMHFTEMLAMGGPVIRYEPAKTTLLELYLEFYQIFLQADWLGYFQRL